MSLLITGGGTKVKIDSVRHLGNNATGSFPSKIVLEYLKRDVPVTYLISDSGNKPFEVRLDVRSEDFSDVKDSIRLLKSLNKELYTEKLYTSYDEYSDILTEELYKGPSLAYLGAAVSDFSCKIRHSSGLFEPQDKKIESNKEQNLVLTPTQKLIGLVKKISPTTKLVGFKLLYEVPRIKLIAAAAKSIEENKCDVVIANDYHKIQQGKPEILLVSNDGVKIVSYSKFMVKETVELINEYITNGNW